MARLARVEIFAADEIGGRKKGQEPKSLEAGKRVRSQKAWRQEKGSGAKKVDWVIWS